MTSKEFCKNAKKSSRSITCFSSFGSLFSETLFRWCRLKIAVHEVKSTAAGKTENGRKKTKKTGKLLIFLNETEKP